MHANQQRKRSLARIRRRRSSHAARALSIREGVLRVRPRYSVGPTMTARRPYIDAILRRARAAALAVALACAGCSHACSDHPYVPYTIEPSASVTELVDAGSPPQEEDAASAP